MMTPEVAKRFLFDQLAEELATLLPVPGQLPAWLAVKIDNMPEKFPSREVVSLATAFCRLHFRRLRLPLLEEVPTCYWKNVTDYLVGQAQALIIDAERETLANINVFFQNKILPDFIVVTNYDDDGSGYSDQISYDLRENDAITRIAIERLFKELKKDIEPLALIHFTEGGFDHLYLFEEEKERQKRSNRNDPKAVEQICYNFCKNRQYEGTPLDSRKVVEWVNQFKQAGFVQEACEILSYLRRYGFLAGSQVEKNILSFYKGLKETLGEKQIITMTIQPKGKSESKFTYRLFPEIVGQLLTLKEAIDKVNRASPNNYPIDLVCFDDFIGSGETMLKHLFPKEFKASTSDHPMDFVCFDDFKTMLGRLFPDLFEFQNSFADDLIKCFAKKKAKLTVLVSHADERGINALCKDPRSHDAITVLATQPVRDQHRAFHRDSPIFSDKSRMKEFKKYCKKIGNKIYPKAPLGWGDAQWCIVTDYSVPDCSLPILWASGNRDFPWVPLFPRKRKT